MNWVDPLDRKRWTALMRAAMGGHTECASALLAAKADANRGAADGKTALMQAVAAGKVGVVKLLCDAKAMPDVQVVIATCVPWTSARGRSVRAASFMFCVDERVRIARFTCVHAQRRWTHKCSACMRVGLDVP